MINKDTYKRLTEKDWHKEKFYPKTNNERVIRKRLWDLENKIECGTLFELACKVGDIVYKDNPDQIRLFEDSEEKLCTTGCNRTGCIFCAFGAHLDERGGGRSRFERLKETHPKQYKYCIEGGEYNENGIWQPNKQGLGLGHVFDELNKIYGEDFIKYK